MRTFFHRDDVSTVRALLAKLESDLADSVTLVAAGTGTLGSTYDLQQEELGLRMSPWGPKDLFRFLDHLLAKRRSGETELTQPIDTTLA